MNKPITISKEILYKGNTYRFNGVKWSVLMCGTYVTSCNGIPSYRFMPIEETRVPDEVKNHD